MEIRLLNEGYKGNETFYNDFLNDKILENDNYFSDKTVIIEESPDFPIYIAKGSEDEKKENFKLAFEVIASSYINTGVCQISCRI